MNNKALNDILPFGETNRNEGIQQFIEKEIKPLTEEDKQKDIEILSNK